MSDENRDADTGQFTPSTDGLYGREAELVQNGFKPMADPEKKQTTDFADEREAADALAASEPDDGHIEEVIYYTPQGDAVPATEAITIERAALDYSNWESSKANDAALSVSKDFAAEVDKMRADAATENLGLEPSAETPDKTAAVPAAQPASVDGLDPDVEKALAHPQIRQAIEEQFSEANKAQQVFANGLKQGQQFLQATIASLAPQLQNLPLEHWDQALATLAQTDPVRAQLVVDAVGKWNTFTQEQQRYDAYREQVSRQDFEQRAKADDDRFDAMVANEDPARVKAAKAEAPAYFKELGLNENQLRALYNNPVFRSAEAQRIMFDAIQFRLMNKAARARPARDLPPVQRPGTAGPRPSFASDVEAKFNRNPSIKNAATLYASKNRG